MNARQPSGIMTTNATRAAYARGVAFGMAAGIVIGASLAFALTRPMEDVVRLLRDRMHGEIAEPQFELLN